MEAPGQLPSLPSPKSGADLHTVVVRRGSSFWLRGWLPYELSLTAYMCTRDDPICMLVN